MFPLPTREGARSYIFSYAAGHDILRRYRRNPVPSDHHTSRSVHAAHGIWLCHLCGFVFRGLRAKVQTGENKTCLDRTSSSSSGSPFFCDLIFACMCTYSTSHQQRFASLPPPWRYKRSSHHRMGKKIKLTQLTRVAVSSLWLSSLENYERQRCKLVSGVKKTPLFTSTYIHRLYFLVIGTDSFNQPKKKVITKNPIARRP